MNQILNKLKKHITENPLNYDKHGKQTLLDTLYYLYLELHAVDTPKMKECFLNTEALLEHLNFREQDAVYTLMLKLCAEQERAAFQTGVRVGVQLMQETLGK